MFKLLNIKLKIYTINLLRKIDNNINKRH